MLRIFECMFQNRSQSYTRCWKSHISADRGQHGWMVDNGTVDKVIFCYLLSLFTNGWWMWKVVVYWNENGNGNSTPDSLMSSISSQWMITVWLQAIIWTSNGSQSCICITKACLLPLARGQLRVCSVNHRSGYFSNLACEWLSIVWAYSKQETEVGPRPPSFNWVKLSIITKVEFSNSLSHPVLGWLYVFSLFPPRPRPRPRPPPPKLFPLT